MSLSYFLPCIHQLQIQDDEELPEDKFHRKDMLSMHILDQRQQDRKEKQKKADVERLKKRAEVEAMREKVFGSWYGFSISPFECKIRIRLKQQEKRGRKCTQMNPRQHTSIWRM